MGISNVGDSDGPDNGAGLGTSGQTNPNLGGPLYPYANQWWEFDRESNRNAGLSFSHDFGRVRADLSYDYTGSSGHFGYTYAPVGGLAFPDPAAVAAAGAGFPDNKSRTQTLTMGPNFRLNPNAGVRVYGT